MSMTARSCDRVFTCSQAAKSILSLVTSAHNEMKLAAGTLVHQGLPNAIILPATVF